MSDPKDEPFDASQDLGPGAPASGADTAAAVDHDGSADDDGHGPGGGGDGWGPADGESPSPDEELARAAAAAGPNPPLAAPRPVGKRTMTGRLVALGVLVAAVVLAVVYGPRFMTRLGELRAQRGAAEYAPLRTLVVYDEAPARAADLLGNGAAGRGGYVALPLGDGAGSGNVGNVTGNNSGTSSGNASASENESDDDESSGSDGGSADPGDVDPVGNAGPPVAGHVPAVWRELRRWAFPASPEPPGALLFLHERQTANGVRGIVAVEADRAARRLRVAFIHPGTYTAAPTTVADGRVKPPPKEGMIVLSAGRDPFESMLPPAEDGPAARADLRFFAGRADPLDWTHIVIPYELDGYAGELELWVADEATFHYVDRRFATKR